MHTRLSYPEALLVAAGHILEAAPVKTTAHYHVGDTGLEIETQGQMGRLIASYFGVQSLLDNATFPLHQHALDVLHGRHWRKTPAEAIAYARLVRHFSKRKPNLPDDAPDIARQVVEMLRSETPAIADEVIDLLHAAGLVIVQKVAHKDQK